MKFRVFSNTPQSRTIKRNSKGTPQIGVRDGFGGYGCTCIDSSAPHTLTISIKVGVRRQATMGDPSDSG